MPSAPCLKVQGYKSLNVNAPHPVAKIDWLYS